jgi:hypothetical protein
VDVCEASPVAAQVVGHDVYGIQLPVVVVDDIISILYSFSTYLFRGGRLEKGTVHSQKIDRLPDG